jgi:chromosomal replication initiator protein
MRAVTTWMPLNPAFTFDTFVVGPSNKLAFNAAKAVANGPGSRYNPLFIYGPTGLGCTHLMQAIGHHVMAKSDKLVGFCSAEGFLNGFISALQDGRRAEFRRRLRSADMLLLDDVGFLADKERTGQELLHLFNDLYADGKQMVFSGDEAPVRMTGLEQGLAARFEGGLCVEILPPDLETRVAILRRKLKQLHSTLPEECLLYIARHIPTNVRCLEGALHRATSYASLSGKRLTLAALELLGKEIRRRFLSPA